MDGAFSRRLECLYSCAPDGLEAHIMTDAAPQSSNDMQVLEAAAFRRLVRHLRERTDVQNIDLMNLAGFCRNCLANWLKEAADAAGRPMSKEESRELVYGMPYDEWRKLHQTEASPAQKAAFAAGGHQH
jgi:hypothetical protein